MQRQRRARPVRPDTRAKHLDAIANGRAGLDEFVNPHRPDMVISLALTPDIVKAALDGRLPRGIGVTRLIGPSTWTKEPEMLGLPVTE